MFRSTINSSKKSNGNQRTTASRAAVQQSRSNNKKVEQVAAKNQQQLITISSDLKKLGMGLATSVGGIATFGSNASIAFLASTVVALFLLVYALVSMLFKPSNTRVLLEKQVRYFTKILNERASENARNNNRLYKRFAGGKITRNEYNRTMSGWRNARTARNADVKKQLHDFQQQLINHIQVLQPILNSRNVVNGGQRRGSIISNITSTAVAMAEGAPRVLEAAARTTEAGTQLFTAVQKARVAPTEAAHQNEMRAKQRLNEVRQAGRQEWKEAINGWTDVAQGAAEAAVGTIEAVSTTGTRIAGSALGGFARSAFGR
jgi:uncharacterized membrane protein